MKTSTRIAALLVPCLVLLGCGVGLPRLQTVPLTGDTAGLGKLEGRWFDRDGTLTVEISGSRNPRLSVLLPSDLQLTDARVRNGRLSFRIQSERSTATHPSCFDFQKEQEIAIDDFLPALVREPPAAWVLRQSAKRSSRVALRAAREIRDGVMDRIARVL